MTFLAVFRADSSSYVGSGHVMRCLTLAESLRVMKVRCVFVCRELPGHLCSLIEVRGFTVVRLPNPISGAGLNNAHDLQFHDAEETRAAILMMSQMPDWLVVDHYGIDKIWELQNRSAVKSIIVIDDLANRHHDCDVLLDQNLVANLDIRYDGLVPDNCVRLLGPHFALLQQEYRAYKPDRNPMMSDRRILVYLGGADQRHLTTLVVQALLKWEKTQFKADVVVHRASGQYDQIVRLTAGRSNFNVHSDLPSLAPLLSKATIAIGASGATSWERLYFGVPSIVIPIADNQLPLAVELERRQFAVVVAERDVEGDGFGASVELAFAARRDDLFKAMTGFVDGLGSDRVATTLCWHAGMMVKIRKAAPEDEAVLLIWANDPDTRGHAFNSEPISAENHTDWFSKKLADPENSRIFVLQTESGLPIGQIRFDRVDSAWMISYSLASHIRGQRLGAKLIDLGVKELYATVGPCTVIGLVKPTNTPSRRVFLRCGFAENQNDHKEYVEFRRECGSCRLSG